MDFRFLCRFLNTIEEILTIFGLLIIWLFNIIISYTFFLALKATIALEQYFLRDVFAYIFSSCLWYTSF